MTVDRDAKFALQIHGICSEIMDGKPDSLEEFTSAWPTEANRHELFAQIYVDCESAVEHTPARLFSGKINWTAWCKSGLYELLQLDRLVLERVINGQSLTKAFSCRTYALTQASAADADPDWEALLDECLAEPSALDRE